MSLAVSASSVAGTSGWTRARSGLIFSQVRPAVARAENELVGVVQGLIGREKTCGSVQVLRLGSLSSGGGNWPPSETEVLKYWSQRPAPLP